MKTNQILPATGLVTMGILLGTMFFAIFLLPHYQNAIRKEHYAKEVINQCIDQYSDFYDTVGEMDCWTNYVEN